MRFTSKMQNLQICQWSWIFKVKVLVTDGGGKEKDVYDLIYR